jgi:hypothetical protein
MNLCGLGPQQVASFGGVASQPYCEPFRVLADICLADMPRMRGCSKYTQVRKTLIRNPNSYIQNMVLLDSETNLDSNIILSY